MKQLSLIFLFGIISCLNPELYLSPMLQAKRNELVKLLKAKVPFGSSSSSNTYGSYIPSTDFKASFVPIKNADSELKRDRLPPSIHNFVLGTATTKRTAPYELSTSTNTLVERSLVAAEKVSTEDGDFIVYVYVYGRVNINKTQLTRDETYQTCKRKWYCLGLCKKCKTNHRTVNRDHTASEYNTLRTRGMDYNHYRMTSKLNEY